VGRELGNRGTQRNSCSKIIPGRSCGLPPVALNEGTDQGSLSGKK